MTHALLSLAAVAALATPAAPSAPHAFVLASRGDLAEASAEAGRVLAGAPGDPVALLVEACVAIERNELDRATDFAARLEAAGSARGAVLRRLAERRRASPGEPMRIALGEAWRAAGAPDLEKDLPKDAYRALSDPDAPMLPGLASDLVKKLTPAERAALAGWPYSGVQRVGDRAATRASLLAAAETAAQNPLWVNLLLLESVPALDADPAEYRSRAVDAQRRVAEAASAADSTNGYYRMISVLAGGLGKDRAAAAPLAPAELDALEAGAAAPRFVWPRRILRQQLAVRLGALDPSYGELRANMLALMIYPLYNVPLGYRAEATTDPGGRARAAHVLAAIGRRLGESTNLLDRMIGAVLDEQSARLTGDEAAIAASRARGEALHAWQTPLSAAIARLGAWPLVSTWREFAPEDEIAYFERLAR